MRRKRAEDPEAARAYGRAYYARDKEGNAKKRRDFRSKNIERERELGKQRRDNDEYREYARVKSSQWRKDHPNEAQSNNARRRATQVGVTTGEPVNRLVVAERDGWICQICHKPIDSSLTHRNSITGTYDPGYLNVDHIVPLALGGSHSYANVQASHAICNLRKGRK